MNNILVCDPVGESGIELLKKRGYHVILRPDINAQELLEEVVGVVALVVRGRTKVTKEVIDRGKRLKVIARSGSGVDNIDRTEARKKNVIVVNAPGANAESVAEHVFALLLGLTRNIPQAASAMKNGGWSKDTFEGMELLGKTLGVVGFGHVGKRVAELGAAFGMKMLVFNRTTDDEDKRQFLKKLGGTFVSLDLLLQDSDVVSLHVSLTDETRGFLDASKLALMKKSAYLINTARGALVNEQALIDALTRRALAGAALDVFTTEPLPDDSPLRKLTNVILTPHVGADSCEGENRASLMVAEDINRVLNGQQAQHPI